MDWARAIERNSEAINGTIKVLFAMLAVIADRIPRSLHAKVLRLLRPAESAARRLVIIVARGIVVKPRAPRLIPADIVRTGGKLTNPRFKLFDPRKQFAVLNHQSPPRFLPRIRTFGNDPRFLALWPSPQPTHTLPPDGLVNATRILRRLQALKFAMDDLPRQARRLAHWRARRDHAAQPKFKSPLRPGPPPGYRKIPIHDIDAVLTECHGLARYALEPNTS